MLRPMLDPEQVTLEGVSSHTPDDYEDYGFNKSDFDSPRYQHKKKQSVEQQNKGYNLTE